MVFLIILFYFYLFSYKKIIVMCQVLDMTCDTVKIM